MKNEVTINQTTLSVGDDFSTGVRIVGIGTKYIYVYSIWDDGSGRHSGYAKISINDLSYGMPEWEWIPRSRALVA